MNGFDVAKLTDKNFLRTLENAVRFGKWALLENIQETLDAALEPILMQQTFKQGGQDMMKLGENTIPCDLGVPRCCGAFTPSMRLVSIRRGRGWSLFRFWGRSDRVCSAQVDARGGGLRRESC